MLTNKAKQTAETIREQVAQLLEVSADFGKIYERKAREHWRAAAAWYAWQHFKEYEARTSTPEEAAKAEETHNTNPREWVATVEQKSGEKERARVALYVARVNLINNLNETAERVAELVRPYWREFALRRGFDDLGAAVSPTYSEKDKDTAHAFRVLFKVSGGNLGATITPASFIRLNVSIQIGGVACGIWGEVEGVYMGNDQPDTPQDVPAAHVLTVAEYLAAEKRLHEINEQARQTLDKLSRESRTLVRSLGLYGFAEFLAAYSLTISK